MTGFRVPTHVQCASGVLSRIDNVVERHNACHILLIIDAGLAATPWPGRVHDILKAAGYSITISEDVEPNPRYSTVDRIAERSRAAEVELIVGLGGGSVLDAGKAVAMLLKNSGSCLDYEGRNRFRHGSAPFVAIPTTCGTGSEVTWVSVISHSEERRKLSVKGEAMFPTDALIDPDVLVTLPAHLIASTGMDAYTHALEAYTCNCSNPISDALAEMAIQLLDRYLLRAFRDIEDQQARFEVMRAATLAGMAFGNADVAAVHCLSESIGGIWDAPHGLVNAMLLVPVMHFHRPVVEDRLAGMYTSLVSAASGSVEQNSRLMLDSIKKLVEDLEIQPFETLQIPEDAFPEIAAASVANNSNGSNPQLMSEVEYMSILGGIPDVV